MTIPVIDIFAGPGGLGEGFSAATDGKGQVLFRVALSIEKDANAHRTLRLRSFFRQFERGTVPEEYYAYARQELELDELLRAHPRESLTAETESWQYTLGDDSRGEVRKRVKRALGEGREWVLIGGPPCQAYSLVGRSRNMGLKSYVAAADKRHFLYRHYLDILATHRPAVFVMENVKGLLSASVSGESMFSKILADLQSPGNGRNRRVEYDVRPLVRSGFQGDFRPADFVVRCENHGIPQARHRVILLGVRKDLRGSPEWLRTSSTKVTARQALQGAAALRSGLSRKDSDERWLDVIRSAAGSRWVRSAARFGGSRLTEKLDEVIERASVPRMGRGAEFVNGGTSCDFEADFMVDPRLNGLPNHSTRGHMDRDLLRYLYASCFAAVVGDSPNLDRYPADLLPKHDNVSKAVEGAMFSDRFRVQVWHRPATTITSHISKDGHYYIHPDPDQCRSLTVREAARLQTFPDNYLFTGPRTSQYVQVGNAVPPLLARQIAELVSRILK